MCKNQILEWLRKDFNFEIQKIVKVHVEKATTASKRFKISVSMATRRNSQDPGEFYGTLVIGVKGCNLTNTDGLTYDSKTTRSVAELSCSPGKRWAQQRPWRCGNGARSSAAPAALPSSCPTERALEPTREQNKTKPLGIITRLPLRQLRFSGYTCVMTDLSV